MEESFTKSSLMEYPIISHEIETLLKFNQCQREEKQKKATKVELANYNFVQKDFFELQSIPFAKYLHSFRFDVSRSDFFLCVEKK